MEAIPDVKLWTVVLNESQMTLWQVLQASDPAYCSPVELAIITFFWGLLYTQQLKTTIHNIIMLVIKIVRL